jgi:hypothetical protein
VIGGTGATLSSEDGKRLLTTMLTAEDEGQLSRLIQELLAETVRPREHLCPVLEHNYT